MSLKWNQHCLGILAILIVRLLCSLSNTFAPKCLDSSTAVKGGFFTPFMHFRCRTSVGSVYLTLLGVCCLLGCLSRCCLRDMTLDLFSFRCTECLFSCCFMCLNCLFICRLHEVTGGTLKLCQLAEFCANL